MQQLVLLMKWISKKTELFLLGLNVTRHNMKTCDSA